MSDHPYTAEEALKTWDSVKDTPPRDPPSLNGGHGGGGGGNGSGYAWNEEGNALRLLDAGGRHLLLYVEKEQYHWHYWDGNCWPLDEHRKVQAWMEQVIHDAYTATWQNGASRAAQSEEAKWLLTSGNDHHLRGALAYVANHVAVKPDVFDTHDWYLPCNDGRTYDLETGRVLASKPGHLMTRCVPYPALDEPGAHPRFDAMLARVTCGDKALQDYLLLTLGLCLTGYTGEKCFWFWKGPTDAGKTTLLMLMAGLAGPFVYAIPLRALLKKRGDTGILHDIAGVRGMRLVFAEEFKPGDILDTEWIKRITGGGDITADRKGENNITFRSTAKLIIGTNDMPVITDIDDALRGRVRVVPFKADIPAMLKAEGKPLQSVSEAVAEVLSEAPAVLYTLVQRVAAWRAERKRVEMPPLVAEASKVYLNAQDPLVDWFEACFEKGEDGELTGHRVELPLKTWYWSFLKQSGKPNTNPLYQQFGDMLIAKGFTKRVSYKGRMFTGPALTPEAHAEAETLAFEDEDREARKESYRV